MSENLCVQDMPGLQTGEIFSPVEGGYESLGVEGTKKAYHDLNAALDGLTNTLVQTMEQIVPYLFTMQSLLSQRGAARRTVLKRAGLPRWTQWVESYAKSLNCTVRTIQLHIKQLRDGQEGGASDWATAAEKRTKGSEGPKPVRLDGRQQAALVKAQLAVNDLVVTLKSGGDWHSALAEYENVAVNPAKLDKYLNVLNAEPDWKVIRSSCSTQSTIGASIPNSALPIERVWEMPSRYTFNIKAVDALLKKEMDGGVWVDPFAGMHSPAQITNDLNPEARAMFHLDALEFLKAQPTAHYDGVLYDPPYSQRAVRDCYDNIGIEHWDGSASFWSETKDECARIIKPGGKAICFGWNSMGMGKDRGFEMTRILLVSHGGNRNDTIITVEICL